MDYPELEGVRVSTLVLPGNIRIRLHRMGQPRQFPAATFLMLGETISLVRPIDSVTGRGKELA